MLKKTTFREIRGSLGRFLAIFAIITLGVGFFAGLSVTKKAMLQSADKYITQYALFDYRLVSSQGYDEDSVETIRGYKGVTAAEGAVEADVLFINTAGSDSVLAAHSLTDDVNIVDIVCGRMPAKPDECVVDSDVFKADAIGTKITFSVNNDQDTLDKFKYREYTIVGTAESVYYLNYDRGTSSLGNGNVKGFLYLMPEGFNVDYYTQVFLKLDTGAFIYSDEYDDYIGAAEDGITDLAEEQADVRYKDIVAEANEKINDAQAELSDAQAEYLEKRADAEKELEDAEAELESSAKDIENGKKEIADGWIELCDQVAEGEKKIADGEKELADSLNELNDGEREYAEGVQELSEGEDEYDDGFTQYQEGLGKYEDGKNQYEEGLEQYNDAEDELNQAKKKLAAASRKLSAAKEQLDAAEANYSQLNTLYSTADGIAAQLAEYGMSYDANALIAALAAGDNPALNAAVDSALSGYGMDSASLVYNWTQAEAGIGMSLTPEYLAGLRIQIDSGWEEYHSGKVKYNRGRKQYEEGKDKLEESWQELEDSRVELENAEIELVDSKKQLDDAWQEILSGRAELVKARADLDDGWRQYYDGQRELEDARDTLKTETEKAKQELYDAQDELEDGQAKYAKGLSEYREAKDEADKEFADAEVEIADGDKKLSDAKADVANIEYPDVFVLDRTSNVGYMCFESDSDIVADVSKVFPFFFFLLAALICITTMTRMVDEQRTQIGVLKALGYGEAKIAAKYMLYSGSASLLGCVTGIIAGSYVFPKVIWEAYKIMYGFGEIEYVVDMKLSVMAVAIYLTCVIGATWLSCRTELSMQAAELIRPKAPKSGKRVFLEYIPFIWKRMGFLEKVSARNVLRYKKRLFMMILGVGGCTALMLAGFGIKDSIANVTNFQYDEIMTYDASVTFIREPDAAARTKFLSGCGDAISDIMFLHESSVDTVAADKTTSASLLIPEKGNLDGFIDLHDGERSLADPGPGEAIINIGLAETIGISVGDTMTIRDGNMDTFTVTISGIFDNYINNFVYMTTKTYESKLGKVPEFREAFIEFMEGADPHVSAAKLLGQDGVGNVTLSVDTRDRLGAIMGNLIYIVILTIVTAGLLAFVVIYNLTNINITERVREIATIKVLGFYPPETAAYVFRENIIMMFLGTIAGLGMGKALHIFIMNQIKIDTVSFDVRIIPLSYLYASVLTIVFACIVNMFMYFRLKKINMAESLKSIE
ncbi:MAG: FtsX-like permease family protein [Oscillospiraceae bacterium]